LANADTIFIMFVYHLAARRDHDSISDHGLLTHHPDHDGPSAAEQFDNPAGVYFFDDQGILDQATGHGQSYEVWRVARADLDLHTDTSLTGAWFHQQPITAELVECCGPADRFCLS
jgi:hypothetical protein